MICFKWIRSWIGSPKNRKEFSKKQLYHRRIEKIKEHYFQKETCLVTYWKSRAMGTGPGLSFYIFDQEVMRFDCLGEGGGHFHVFNLRPGSGVVSDNQIYFEEKAMEAQIHQTVLELQQNASRYLSFHQDKSIRELRLEMPSFLKAVQEAGQRMLDLKKGQPVL